MYLLNKWNVDMASFVETQADWRYADKGHQFDNLFARGRDRHSISAYTSTVKRVLCPRNWRGGTVMMTFGRAVAGVYSVNRYKTKLGRLCWTNLGGSGKNTYVMTRYMPHNKENVDTKRQTVWGQHKIY